MAIVVEIDQLRRNLRGDNERITSLKAAKEAAISNLAIIQLMRETGDRTIKLNPDTDNQQIHTYRSPILEALRIPTEQQLMMAEALAGLEVRTNEIKTSFITAAIAKKKGTVVFGNLQRHARQFSLAQPYIQALQKRIEEGLSDLEEMEQAVLADPEEEAIIRFQTTTRLLRQSDLGMQTTKSRLMAATERAQQNAAMAELPDLAIDVATNSGIAQGITINDREGISLADYEDDLSTYLAIRLAQEIKFV